MYYRRFRNRKKRQVLKLGSFSLFHMGGGSFFYSFAGKSRSYVVRMELNTNRYRLHGFSLIFTLAVFLGVLSFLPNTSTADSVSLDELEQLEAGLSPIDLEVETEKLKQQLVNNEENRKFKPAATSDDSIIKYTVVSGDTLSYIAQQHRVPIEMITASSGIQIDSIIRPGQTLIIPRRRGLVYKIKKGDRLAHVAQYYSVNLDTILDENQFLENTDIVSPGTTIFLPNAKIPQPPPAWRRPAQGRITSGYGRRWHPIFKKRRFHYGIDIASRYGPVYAARNGHIIFSGYLGSYGKTVIIEHTSGYKTLYAHLKRLRVKKGDYVKTRQRIGTSGNTGLSTGPHLHFEVIRYGKAINPRRIIRF